MLARAQLRSYSDLSGNEHPRDEGRSLRSGNPSASPDPLPHHRGGRGGEPTVSCDGAAYEHPSAPLPRSPGACSLLTLAPGRERAARENPARNPRAPPPPPPLPPGTRGHQREESEWWGRVPCLCLHHKASLSAYARSNGHVMQDDYGQMTWRCPVHLGGHPPRAASPNVDVL